MSSLLHLFIQYSFLNLGAGLTPYGFYLFLFYQSVFSDELFLKDVQVNAERSSHYMILGVFYLTTRPRYWLVFLLFNLNVFHMLFVKV